MPRYDYYCAANDTVIEVVHPLRGKLQSWGQVCERSGHGLGGVPANTPVGNSGLKNLGFTKLVKRDKGVYENVTRSGTEKRYMKSGDISSMPHLHKKLGE